MKSRGIRGCGLDRKPSSPFPRPLDHDPGAGTQIMKLQADALTQTIRTQQGSQAIKCNGLSNHNEDRSAAGQSPAPTSNPPPLTILQPTQPGTS